MRGMGTSKQINRDKDRELLCYLLDEIDTAPKKSRNRTERRLFRKYNTNGAVVE